MVGSPGGSSRTSLRQDPLSLFGRNTNVEELFWSDYADIGVPGRAAFSFRHETVVSVSSDPATTHPVSISPKSVTTYLRSQPQRFPQLPNKIAHAEQTRSRHGRRRLHRVEHREPPRRRQRRDRRRRLLPWHSENLSDQVEFVNKSVVDEDLPTDVDIVFHLAALSSYKMHEENPAKGARVNVEGFVNTIEQARKDGCETVVYATTSSIYGDRTEPSPESMAVEARTGYEASSSHVSATQSTSTTSTA